MDNTIGLTLEPNEILLEVIIEPIPQYDPYTQRMHVVETVNPETQEWVKSYIVEDKTPLEIERLDWTYNNYAKRIVAPMAMITDPNDNNGVKMYTWFQAQGLPTEKNGTNIRLYCNTILPEHQYLVSMYGGIITIENYPT